MLTWTAFSAHAYAIMWLDDDEDSDDSATEHNVWNGLPQLFAHCTISPLPVLGLDDTTELAVATSCHFALGVFTMVQQDLPPVKVGSWRIPTTRCWTSLHC